MRKLVLALLALAACSEPTSDPERAFRLFVDEVQTRDVEGAWNLIAPESREQLTELVEARSKASGGAIPADPKQAVLGDATLARPVEKIEVKEKEGDKAILAVTSGGETQEVRMVRTAEGWRVAIDLPAAP